MRSLPKLPDWIKPPRPFEGIARKVVLLFITLSAIGWMVYVIGFGEFVKEQKDEYSKYDPADYPFLIAFWAASVVGPVLFLLAILHAALWKWPSAATGSVVAILGAVYVTSIGYGGNIGGIRLSAGLVDKTSYKLWVAGCVITCLFWAITQAFWLWFPFKSISDLKNLTTMKPLKPVTGIARKVALPLIGVSAAGWLISMGGFIKLYDDLEDSNGDFYWGWVTFTSGFILYILAVLHTVLWGLPSVIIGSLTAVFGVLYMTSAGFGLYWSGQVIQFIQLSSFFRSYEFTEIQLLFAGSFLSILFLGISQALWPWYATGIEPEEELKEDRKKLWKWIAFSPYKPVEGVFRKAVLVVIGISVIGWIVFISGFGTYIKLGFGLLSSTHVVTTVLHVVNVSNNSLLGLKLDSEVEEDDEMEEDDDYYDYYYYDYNDKFYLKYAPELYWGWTGCFGGLVVYLLATAHAVTWTRISCILGSITAIVGMMYITAVGYSFVWSGIVIDGDGQKTWFSDSKHSKHHSLLFAGSFLIYLFWGVMQALWLWFPYGTVSAFKESLKMSPPRIFEGAARKIALPLIILSAIGCSVFASGFQELRYSTSDKELGGLETGPWVFWGWAGSVVGPVACLLAVVHALLWKIPSAAVGTLTAMLGALYVAAVGFGMVYVGIAFTANLHLGDFDTLYKKIFSGGLIACFFWAMVVALWPWYSSGLSEEGATSSDEAGQNHKYEDQQVLNAEKTAIELTPYHQ